MGTGTRSKSTIVTHGMDCNVTSFFCVCTAPADAEGRAEGGGGGGA